LMTAEHLSRCPVKNTTAPKGVSVKIGRVLTAKFLGAGNNKVLDKWKRSTVFWSLFCFVWAVVSIFGMHPFDLVLHPTSHTNMTKPFLFSFKHGVMILRVGARTLLVLAAKQNCCGS